MKKLLQGIVRRTGGRGTTVAMDALGFGQNLSVTQTGTEGADSLVGSDSELYQDVLQGLGGDDVLQGLGGSDLGYDLLQGGKGNDTLKGSYFNDTYRGDGADAANDANYVQMERRAA